MPDEFKEWVTDNSERIILAHEKETEPYWIRNNNKYIDVYAIKGGSAKDILHSVHNHITLKENTAEEQAVTKFTKKQEENHILVSKSLQIEQGARMSFREADSGNTNPHYNWIEYFWSIDKSGYNKNCVMATATHELRMRGWNVTAVPYDNNNEALRNIRADFTSLWIDPKTKQKPNQSFFRAKTEERFWKGLEKNTSQVGRYHLAFYTSQGGHILCVDKLTDGKLRIYDPQDNMLNTTSWIKDISKTKSCQILRVDNLLINPSKIKHVAVSK